MPTGNGKSGLVELPVVELTGTDCTRNAIKDNRSLLETRLGGYICR